MATAISMPKLGMTMEEGTVLQWPVSVGDSVAKGDVVLVIESEKNEADVEAPSPGFFRHVYVEVGDTVPCGTLLGAITETADEPFDCDAFHAAEAPGSQGARARHISRYSERVQRREHGCNGCRECKRTSGTGH